MTKDDIDRIKGRLEKVTAGEWTPYIEGRDFTSGSSFIMIKDGETRRADIEFNGASAYDIDFMGNAKHDVTVLIQEIERLRIK